MLPRVLALALLLTSPAAAALAPLPLPKALPLELAAALPAEVVVGVPVQAALEVRSSGVLGKGTQPQVERRVDVNATLDSGEPATVTPSVVVLAAGAGSANATVAFTPGRLGPLQLHLQGAWQTLPGKANLTLATTVRKDDLAVEGLAADAPDASLKLPLHATLRSGHHAAEPLAWRLEAEHWPVNGTEPLRWVAAQGTGTASPAGVPLELAFLARYGSGSYDLRLHAGGARLADAEAAIKVAVPDVRRDAGEVNFSLEVEEHPTTLHLASDTVNADGKAKTPGNAVITRVVVGDLNGLADVASLTFTYVREEPQGPVPIATRVVEGLGPGLTAAVEDRFDLAPLKDAAYRCIVTAQGTGTARVERTFVILDVQPDAALRLANTSFLPARPGVLHGTLVVRDGNFGTGPLDGGDVRELENLTLLLYKGSTRVSEAGWSVAAAGAAGPAPLALDLAPEGSRSTRHAYRVADGKGQLELPVEVRIPEGAAAGSYRLSVADDATLASAPFNVTALPRITRLTPGPAALPGAALALQVQVAPARDVAALAVRLPWGATVRAERPPGNDDAWDWNATIEVPLPWDDEAAGNLTALADLGDGRVVLSPAGAPVNARSLALPVANAPPTLDASLRIGGVAVGRSAWVHPHSADELQLEARATDANARTPDLRDELGLLRVEVQDWRAQKVAVEGDGERAPDAAPAPLRPRGLAAGRYTIVVTAKDDDGAAATQALQLNVGTNFRLDILGNGSVAFAPSPDGNLTANLSVRASGNAPAASLAILAEGLPPGAATAARLVLANGTILDAPLRDGFARFEAPELLSPGHTAELRLRVDARQGIAAGTYAGRIVIAGEAA